jgi:hypothetical protein
MLDDCSQGKRRIGDTTNLLPQHDFGGSPRPYCRVRLAMRGFRSSGSGTSTKGGCLRVVTSFAALIVTILVLLPAIASIVLPYIFGTYGVWFISVPGTILYGVIIYVVVTTLVAPRMLDRTHDLYHEQITEPLSYLTCQSQNQENCAQIVTTCPSFVTEL